MQYDNHDMDKKLKQLEKQSLPDLSKQDEHWQQMQSMLQPASSPAKPLNGKRSIRWMIAAIVAIGLFVTTFMLVNSSKKQKNIVNTKPNPGSIIVPKKAADSSPSISPATVVIKTEAMRVNQQERSTPRNITRATIKPIEDTISKFGISDGPDLSAKDPKATLAAFFQQLEKPSQEFVINNKRDTVINGRDGSALLIPANSFGGHEVVLTLKEFYTYEDIITNKLSTTSNGQQLVTGGMIHLMATVNGKEVNVDPGKSIQWFIPDTASSFNQMQLFNGETTVRQPIRRTIDGEGDYDSWDTIPGGSDSLDFVNWVPDDRYFTSTYLQRSFKVLYLTNEPFKTRHTKKGEVGLFYIAENPKVGREQLATMLKEKYGYHKVKIKKYKSQYYFGILRRRIAERPNSWMRLGDSAWIDERVVKQYNLQPTDSATYIRTNRWRPGGSYVKRSFSNINLDALSNRFSVDIRQLGWINCDRFFNDDRPKENYYVDIGDTATNYYTILAFANRKSMIRGEVTGNLVRFTGIPRGEAGKVICVGIQDGKTVAAMASLPGKSTTINLKFEATDPAAFKEQAATMDEGGE